MLFRPARASDLDEVCALLATPRQGPEYVHTLLTSDPAFEPSQIRVAWTSGHIIACAKMYPRTLRIGTTAVAAGGIGALCMEPRYQERALAASLLAECISAMRLEGALLAPLFAPDHEQALFVQQGWSVLREPELEIPVAALAAATEGKGDAGNVRSAEDEPRGRVIQLPQEIQVRPLESSDLDAVLALHETVNIARTGSVVRDRDTWMGSLATLNARGARMFVAVQGGELAGYVVVRVAATRQRDRAGQRAGQRAEVLELLLAPWSLGAWRPLLRAAAATAGEGTTTLSACLPRDYRALIAGALDGATLAPARDDLLLRIIDPPRLLKEIAPLLATRLRKLPVAEPLRLRVGPLRGGATLSIADGRVTIVPPGRDDPYALPESVFLSLLFGTEDAYARLRDPLAVTNGGLPPLPDGALELLEGLFPPQDWVYWRSDAF